MRTQNRRRSAPRGMTLIEIMVVLVILGMIASLIGYNVMGQLKDAKKKTAELDVKNIANAVDMYQVKHQHLPESLDTLVPNDIKEIHKDPWGSAYVYRPSGDAYEVLSYGPDKAEGGGDWWVIRHLVSASLVAFELMSSPPSVARGVAVGRVRPAASR
jgi:general secretion pathway protein G